MCVCVCVFQLLSCVWLFVTPSLWTIAHQASLSFSISWSLLKLMSMESVMPSNYFTLRCPLFLLPSVFSRIRVFSNKSALLIRLPDYWSFRFSISPSNECSGLTLCRIGSQWEFAVWCRESKAGALWQLTGVGCGGRFKREGTYMYGWLLIHVDVWQKPSQYCKATILQLKIKSKLINLN